MWRGSGCAGCMMRSIHVREMRTLPAIEVRPEEARGSRFPTETLPGEGRSCPAGLGLERERGERCV